jgi:methionyl-tRNA formyltransferase
VPQTGEVVHAPKIAPLDLEIRFAMTAAEIVARTRLETAWFAHSAKRVRVVRARVASPTGAASEPGRVLRVDHDGVLVACGDGAVLLVEVQPEGRSAMSATAWANGARFAQSPWPVSLA